MKNLLIAAVLVLMASQAWAAGESPMRLGGTSCGKPNTVSNLPTCDRQRLCIVTDGATDNDCGTGGGTDDVLCFCDGSSWAAIGGTSGSTDGLTFTINADNTGDTEPDDGSGFVVEGGSGDVSCLWDADNDQFDCTGPTGVVFTFPAIAVTPSTTATNFVSVYDNDDGGTNTCAADCPSGQLCLLDNDGTVTDHWVLCNGIIEIFDFTSLDTGDGTKTVCQYFSAANAMTPTAGGPTYAATNADNFSFGSVAFDTSTDETATWVWEVPPNLSGTTATVKYFWETESGCSGTETVCWVMDSGSFADDAAFGSGALGGTALGVTDTCTVNADCMVTASSTLTHGLTAGQLGVFTVTRDVDAGTSACTADDLGGDALLLGWELCYEADNVFSGE